MEQVMDTVALFMSDYHFLAWNMAGPSNAAARQRIMELLTGEKLPKAKCGVTAIGNALHARYGCEGDCMARREKNLAAAMQRALGWPTYSYTYSPVFTLTIEFPDGSSTFVQGDEAEALEGEFRRTPRKLLNDRLMEFRTVATVA